MGRVVAGAALAGVLLGPAAHGGWFVSPAATTAYYYPVYYQPVAVVYAWPVAAAPAYCVPVAPAPVPAPVPARPPILGTFATPTPAPPSPRPPPPAAARQRAPQVNESRAPAGDDPPPMADPDGPARDRVRVGFWNLTERPLTLTIDGEERVLPSRRSLTLHLPRQFTWQVGQRAVQVERVPADRGSLEIVFRR